MRRILFLLLFGAAFSPIAWADSFEGKVTRVLDGDTVEVQDAKGKRHLFRLLGADAPQKGQSGYRQALAELKQRASGQTVMVDWIREQVCPTAGGSCEQLAKILVHGEDLALRQLRRGWAWHDKARLREQSTTDKTLYADAELQSRLRGRGLWINKKAVPPWEFVPPKPVPKPAKKSKRK